jgi:hypothetical protein
MAVRKPKFEGPRIVRLTGNDPDDKQSLAAAYADGWTLVNIIVYFPGKVVAYFHREIDQLAEFSQERRPDSEIKRASLPPPVSIGVKPNVARR